MTAARIPATKASLTAKKTCGRCRRKKVLDDFHVDRKRKDGHQVWCRQCMNAVMRRIMRKKAAELRAFRLLKSMIDVAEWEAAG